MRVPIWLSRTLFVLVVLAVLAATAALVVHLRQRGGTRLGLSDKTTTITASDGVKLSAEVIGPPGKGPYPLLVMPASWNSPALEYRNIGARLAEAGMQVVSYAQRGFRGSGGEVDLGGAKSQHDVSTVIDWALKHTNADPTRIGLFGVSYGGGVSLLAAAHDARVKVVVATSAWTDLAAALVPHGTLNVAGLGWMFSAPGADSSLDPQVRQLERDVHDNPRAAAALLTRMSATRSAIRVVGALNSHRTAIMIANAYDDSLLDPTSLVSFFSKLHTPKRLQLAAGDHGGPEIPGLLGRPDPTVSVAGKWIDHYLNKTKNGIQRSGPVVLEDAATGAMHSYPSWPAARTTLHLGTPGSTGSLASSPTASWSRPLTTGAQSGATSGGQQIQSPDTYQPTKISIDSVKGSAAYVWQARSATRAVRMNGTPSLQLHVDSSAPSVTLFSYLYDVTASGSATLMSYAPATVTPGAVSITLRPLSWTVAAGHHVVLVIDTVDKNFLSVESPGNTVTLSSPASLSVATG